MILLCDDSHVLAVCGLHLSRFLANVATMGADGAALEEAFRELLPE